MTQRQSQEVSAADRERQAEERRQRLTNWVSELNAREPIPWAPLKKPLSQSRLCLITSGGLYLPEQTPFAVENREDFDVSYRELPSYIVSGFLIRHAHYDHTDAEQDINVVYPIDRLHEMAKEGVVKELAPTNYSITGYIPDPAPFLESTCKELPLKLWDQEVDAALLAPA